MGKHSAPKKTSTLKTKWRSPYALAALVPVGLVTAVAGAQQITDEPTQQVADSAASAAVRTASDIESVAPVAMPFVEQIAAEPEPEPAPAPAPEEVPASVANGQIPRINYEAYHAAGSKLAQELPGCGVSWQLIAGIGRVESTHANNGKADPTGVLHSPILGPLLDGTLAGNNVIHDTDDGELDGNPYYDRAVGPMQFLPETWGHYAADGNGDGVADPQNLFDAALTTGHYLCDGGLDLRDPEQVVKAVLRYNNSMDYVAKVRGWAEGY